MRWMTGPALMLALTLSTATWAQFAPIQIAPAQQLWTVDVVDEKEVDHVVRTDPRDIQIESQIATDLSFSSSPQRTKSNLAHFVSKTREQSRSAGDDLERYFASTDVVGGTGDIMRSLGLDQHNVADAYALWWVVTWSAANGTESPGDPETYQAVQRQARAAFGATADFEKTTDADRQQFAEALMVQAVLMDNINDQMRGTTEGGKQISKAAKESAAGMGLNLDSMVLTREGFRPRKGAQLDGMADDHNVQLASSNAKVVGGEGSGLPIYLAIAAAAGAGLGAAYFLGKVANRKG